MMLPLVQKNMFKVSFQRLIPVVLNLLMVIMFGLATFFMVLLRVSFLFIVVLADKITMNF